MHRLAWQANSGTIHHLFSFFLDATQMTLSGARIRSSALRLST